MPWPETGRNFSTQVSTITSPSRSWMSSFCWMRTRAEYQPDMPAPSQIDPAALERLRRLGGEEFVGKMAELFLSYGAQKISEARQASNAADLAAVAKAAHAIKRS